MFGHFINNNKFISPKDGFYYIENGTPIVAIYNSSDFFNKGIVSYIQFGIYTGEGSVICQLYDLSTGCFNIREIPFVDFAFYDCDLFEYTPNILYKKEECLSRAKEITQVTPNFLCSIPGDDFVFWCITGNSMYEICCNQNAGLQYLTPYAIGNVVRAKHHAIAIENGYVIHFSGRRLPKGKRIKFDTFSLFQEESHIAQYVPYTNDSEIYERIWSRNRAIFALCGKCTTGDYSLILNNCEHFCVWCKTGEKRSTQLQQAVLDLASITISILTKKPYPPAIKALQNRIKWPWQKH